MLSISNTGILMLCISNKKERIYPGHRTADPKKDWRPALVKRGSHGNPPPEFLKNLSNLIELL